MADGRASSAGGRASEAHDLFLVGPQEVSLQPLLDAVEEPAYGGVALFLGRVRSPNGGVAVRYLEYEGYVELALKTFADIAGEMRELHGPSRWAMQHRLGRLAPGEVSLAVVVATPHRGPAFDACEQAVEECKRRLPVWKLEVTASGSAFVAGSATAAPTL